MADEPQTTSPQAKEQAKLDNATPTGEQPGVTEGIGAVSPVEQAIRAQHQTEGGGAWPPSLLAERATAPGQPADYAALYEQQAQEAKEAAKKK
jgi:hypothetical protein